MINNNPYNLPDIPPPKQNRIYTDSTVGQYRQEFFENAQVMQSPRSPHRSMSRNNSFKGEELNYQKQLTNIPVRAFIPSPKATNPSYFTSRVALHDKAEQIAPIPLKESSGINPGSFQTINDRIESLIAHIKMNEKRIIELEKNSSGSFLPSNSKISNEETNVSHEAHSLLSKAQVEIQEVLNRVQDTIGKVQFEVIGLKEEMRENRIKIDEVSSKNKGETKEIVEASGKPNSISHPSPNYEHNLHTEIQNIQIELESKFKTNFEFLTSLIARVERDTQNYHQPNYKVSPIKCSHTAILLRFVECFKVRKHSSKTGEAKITLTDNTYYIDNEGYLLDKEQFYLVDSRSNRIRLEDKHLRLLKDEGILL